MKIYCKDYHGKDHVVDEKQFINRLSVYGIYVKNNRVLLIQDPRSLRWELPGGGIEAGETIKQGLIREFIEETGVVPEGDITLVCEWIEYYFDIPSQEAWRSKRQCYRVNSISSAHKLLAQGNGDDTRAAIFVPVNKLKTIQITPQIFKALTLALQQ